MSVVIVSRDPKFYDAEGRLTEYALGCGYTEVKSTDRDKFREGDLYTDLWYEHSTWHVRQIDRRPGAEVFRPFWKTFETLTEAREFFDSQPGD